MTGVDGLPRRTCRRRRLRKVGRAVRRAIADTPIRAQQAAAGITGAVEATAETVRDALTDAKATAAGAIGEGLQLVGEAAKAVGDGALHVAVRAGEEAQALLESAREAPALRRRRLESSNGTPLPSLHALHPGVTRLPLRNLGTREVPVDLIRGTAVEGPDQRGSDFLPLPPFRSSNWEGRWQRIREATLRLENLPPIDVQFFGGGYWVVDGHNRVAAALYEGQVAIDASIVEILAPGATPAPRVSSLAAEVEDGVAIRAAVDGTPPSSAAASTTSDRMNGLSTVEGAVPAPEPPASG